MTLVTVSLAPEVIPTKVLPTLGKIPLVKENIKSTVTICSIPTLTYLTLAGGEGGSEKIIESP